MVSKIGPKTIFLSIFTILLFILLWTSSSKVGLADGSLVAQWHMDEGNGTTISDSSGNGNDGELGDYNTTNEDGNTPPIWVDGKFGKALEFDDKDDYVVVENPNNIPVSTNPITYEAWIRLNSPITGAEKRQLIGWRWSVPTGLRLIGTNRFSFTIYNTTIDIHSYSSDDDQIAIGEWSYIVGVYDGSNVMLYHNGMLVKKYINVAIPRGQRYNDLDFGAQKTGYWYFNGTIDEVSIYNYALSASEIQQHYEEGLEEEDTTPPTVSVSHTPSSPTNSTSMTVTATASDNVGVTSINIYVDASLAKTCSSSPCSTTSQTYSIGTHTYYATASDAANNTGRDPASGTKSFTVQEVAPQCGNNIKETGEECDGTDNLACPGQCLPDCSCPVAPPEEVNFSKLPPNSLKFTEKFRGTVILHVAPAHLTETGIRFTTEEWIEQAKYIGVDGVSLGEANWWEEESSNYIKSALQKYKDAGFLTVFLWNSFGKQNYDLSYNPPLHYWSIDNQDKQMVNYWRVYVDSDAQYATAYRNGNRNGQVAHCIEWSSSHKCNKYKRELDITQNPDGSLTVKIRNMTHYAPVYGGGKKYTIASVYEKYPASEFSWLYDETGVNYDSNDTQYEKGSRLTYGTDYEIIVENNSVYAKIYNPSNRKLNLYILMYHAGTPSIFIPEGREVYFETLRNFLGNFSENLDAHLQNDGGFPVLPKEGDFHPDIITHVETKYGVDFNFDNWVIYYRANYDGDNRHLTQYVFDKENYLIFKDFAKEKQDITHEYGIIYVPTGSDQSGMLVAMIEHVDILLVNTYDDWIHRVARWGHTGPGTDFSPSTIRLGIWEAYMIADTTPGDKIISWSKNAANELLKWNPDGGAIFYWQVSSNKYNITDRLDAFKEATQYVHDKFKDVDKLPSNVERHIVAKVYPISYTYRYGDYIDLNPGQIDMYPIYTKDLRWDSVPTDGCFVSWSGHVPGESHIDDTQAHNKIKQAVNSGSGIALSVFRLGQLAKHYKNFSSIPEMYKNMFQTEGGRGITRENYTSHYLTFNGVFDPKYINGSTGGESSFKLKPGVSVDIIVGEFPYASLYKDDYGYGRVIGYSDDYDPFKTYFTDVISATYGEEYLMRFVEQCTGKRGTFRLWDVGKTYVYKLNDLTYYALLVERYGIPRRVPVIVYGVNYTRITDMDTGQVLNTTVYLEANSSKLLRIDLAPGEGPPSCTEDWTCTGWSDCIDGTQTRICTDNNNCGTTLNKPSESQACEVVCVEDWTCGEWSDCVDGIQARTCTDNNNCGTAKDKPSGYQECEMCIESWLCTEWTECIDSTQARVCTDNNVCGTIELKPHESQACEEVPTPTPEEPTQGATPTGPSGVMGSASAGGGVSSRVITPTIAYEEEITYEFRNHPIYEVTFITLVDISNSKVSVEDLGSIRPIRANVIPDGLIYRYVDLITSNIEEENTDSIKIRLKVPILFYIENDIDPRRTKLQRWTGSDWDVLNTSQIGSDDTYYYFRTLSDSLSLFAITAELTGISPPSTTCDKFCEEGEVLNIDSCECIPLAVTPGGIMLDYETFTYIVTLVSAFIIVLILHRVYRRYRGREMEEI